MPVKFKLLATDIDGTITDERGRIHLKAAETIRHLEERGIIVTLVSGRPLPFVESLSLFVGTSGPVIAENGAVMKIGTGEPVLLGEPKAAKTALAELQRHFPMEFDDDNRYRLVDISIRKTLDPDRIQQFITTHQLPVNLLVTNVMLHLVDSQVSKGNGVLKVIRHLGIAPSEIMVSGDSYNDLPLFEIGATNLAVANAPDVLKRKADYVSERLYGEGFSEMIQKILAK
jgi:phosphoglycolate phosphatase (TIGR01487 family)